jgi:hypothetical protein
MNLPEPSEISACPAAMAAALKSAAFARRRSSAANVRKILAVPDKLIGLLLLVLRRTVRVRVGPVEE